MHRKLPVALYAALLALCSCTDRNGHLHNKTAHVFDTGTSRELSSSSPETPFTDSVPMVTISEGTYTPLFGNADSFVTVKAFMMDIYPVTNQRFLAFVKLNPQWQRSKVKRVYADEGYLNTWQNDTTLPAGVDPDAPVTNVSWFAATAYCKCAGKQLPNVDQWEYVARADEHSTDARKKKSFNQYILSWYEKPQTFNQRVGQGPKNYWGVYDLHGLVWEWTLDFNSVMLSGESRRDVSNDNSLFCGSGSIGANDLMNYAAFMRYAFRGSLKAGYCVQNQGFRCVKQIK